MTPLWQAEPALADLLERHEETGNAHLAVEIGGQVWERADALVLFARPELGSGLNFCCRIRSDAAAVEGLLDAASQWLSDRGAAPHFRVSPLTCPVGLDMLLERRGFTRTEAETQMVLAGEDREPPSNLRVTVERAAPGDLARWVAIQHRGFGGGGEPSALALEMAQASARQDGTILYLARLDGVPVGAAVLVEWAGVRGIYGVAVAEEARHQGVGTVMMRRMIEDARALGSLPICLQAETGSGAQRWYARLGFRVVYDRTGWTKSKA